MWHLHACTNQGYYGKVVDVTLQCHRLSEHFHRFARWLAGFSELFEKECRRYNVKGSTEINSHFEGGRTFVVQLNSLCTNISIRMSKSGFTNSEPFPWVQ